MDKAYVQDGDVGCGAPGSFSWHKCALDQLSRNEKIDYVRESFPDMPDKDKLAITIFLIREINGLSIRQKHPNFLKHISSEWATEMNDNEITCHHKMVKGVLCRWWGDGPIPDGVAIIDKATAEARRNGDGN